MVNETNKPQLSLESEQLGQRLAASNQALEDMQAEHRQLLVEMEQLRRRAEDLQRVREQQEKEEEEKRLQCQLNMSKATQVLEVTENTISAVKNNEQEEKENNESTNLEEADYIKEKLAEIAHLKAQFNRVQHMINTTEMIENHISKTENAQKQSVNELDSHQTESKNKIEPGVTTTAPIINVTSRAPELIVLQNMPDVADLNAAATPDEKEQLILTMLNMFQDFSSDLKSQADNLRAERERIKELKESIIRSRKEQPK